MKARTLGMTSDPETLFVERRDGVCFVTLNRADAHNAFNGAMRRELRELWRGLRRDNDVRVVVLSGAGERAFCVGVDRKDVRDPADFNPANRAGPFMVDDLGDEIGPKSNNLWKPVVCAVNGMACGGAFYLLGEVDILIAARHATFFDPHVSYGLASSYESMHMLQRMPLGIAHELHAE
jgi:enoyl-CoA hydratase/carnithine racemase